MRTRPSKAATRAHRIQLEASRGIESQGPEGERGIAMVALLAVMVIVTVISLALIGLMNTDLTHASLQHAVARSFYLARAGVEEAKVKIAAAADPAAFTTPASGVTVVYGSGHFTYWVDAGPAENRCGAGLKTLEAQGEVRFLGRAIGSRLRACGVGGTPMLAALFGVGPVQLQGAASRVYLAPYQPGTPGGGGSLGSFTEVTAADQDVRLNALSEDGVETVELRDGKFADYSLYGFAERPSYNPGAAVEPVPWVLSVFGDLIKGQPSTGPLPNRCGTPSACLTVGNTLTDITSVWDLRAAKYARHVYVNDFREQRFPPLALAPQAFQTLAAQNRANAALNRIVGLGTKEDSLYERMQFYRLMVYLAGRPAQFLRGPVYVKGTVELLHNWNVGGDMGNVTLAIAGDVIVDEKLTLTNRHDLTTAATRRIPGIVVLGAQDSIQAPSTVCGGQRVTGSGRLVVCGGSTLTVDGLIYTRDGMAIEPKASVDQIGAMYHDTRGTTGSSFSLKDATFVLRFDPLALSAFGHGIAIVSWQELRGPGPAAPPPASPLGNAPGVAALTTATPAVAPEPSAAAAVPSAAPATPVAPVPLPAAPESPSPRVPAPAAPARQAAPATPSTASAPIAAPIPAPAAATPAPATSEPAFGRPAVAPSSSPRGSQSAGPTRPPAIPMPSPGTAREVRPSPRPAIPEARPEFHVQAGAFRNRQYADDLVRQLRANGYAVRVVEGRLIRVWVGPPMGWGAGTQLVAELREKGFEAILSR